MKFVLQSKTTNKNKSTEICPPLLHKPTEICTRVMPRARKGQQKALILKKTTELCPSRSYYSTGERLAGGKIICSSRKMQRSSLYEKNIDDNFTFVLQPINSVLLFTRKYVYVEKCKVRLYMKQ